MSVTFSFLFPGIALNLILQDHLDQFFPTTRTAKPKARGKRKGKRSVRGGLASLYWELHCNFLKAESGGCLP